MAKTKSSTTKKPDVRKPNLEARVAKRQYELAEQALLDGYAAESLLAQFAEQGLTPAPSKLPPHESQLLFLAGLLPDPAVRGGSYSNPLPSHVKRSARQLNLRKQAVSREGLDELEQARKETLQALNDKRPKLLAQIEELREQIASLEDSSEAAIGALQHANQIRDQLRSTMPDYVKRVIAARESTVNQPVQLRISQINRAIHFAETCQDWHEQQILSWFKANRPDQLDTYGNTTVKPGAYEAFVREQQDKLPELEQELEDKLIELQANNAPSTSLEEVWLFGGSAALIEAIEAG